MPLPPSRVVHREVVLCVGIEVVLRAWSRFLVTDDPVAAARSIADSSPGSGTGRCLVAPAAGVSASGYWCRFRLGWCWLGRWCRRCSRSRRCDTRCLVGQSAALLARIVSLNDDVVCAGQRVAQEGSSPSGALMESTVSKSGGNASLAVACWLRGGGQGVHREVESEGYEEQYRAVIEGAIP